MSGDAQDQNPLLAQSALVAWLSTPQAYPERPAEVEIAETHISWVFLTREFVYKLKKPVRFDFLDFSTLERRKAACEEELRLNQRMAPGIYLEVAPVFRNPAGVFTWGKGGRAVDWLVRMRRLPAERMLDHLVRRRALEDSDLHRLTETLARFYARAAATAISSTDYTAAYAGRVAATARELADPRHGLDAVQVERVNTAQQRYLALAADVVGARAAAGRVIEGHGDLRPEHICLIDPPAIFDCIEFNAAFRRIDVVDELSFLAMECDQLGRPDVGQKILARYRAESGDEAPEELVSFYKAYRASVRAKVAALRAAEHAGSDRERDRNEAEAYLALADRYVAQLPRAPLVVVRGISGSGKSTLAAKLAERLGARLLRTDEVRKELSRESDHSDRYRPEARAAVYDEIFARAATLLAQGLMALLDGTFLEEAQRRRARETAEAAGVRCLQLHCVVAPATAQERISKRQAQGTDASEATPALVSRQVAANEPDEPAFPAVEIATESESACEQAIAAITAAIRSRTP